MTCGCAACKDGATHDSDCSVHNAPALPVGLCDCEDGESEMNETLFISLWFICGLIGSGFLFAKLQGSFPKENFRSNLGWAILFSVFGVAALFVGFGLWTLKESK